MRVRVYLRPGMTLVLLARKGMPRGGATWLAARIGVTKKKMTRMLNGKSEVPDGATDRLIRLLGAGRGAEWDDLFRMELIGSDTAGRMK